MIPTIWIEIDAESKVRGTPTRGAADTIVLEGAGTFGPRAFIEVADGGEPATCQLIACLIAQITEPAFAEIGRNLNSDTARRLAEALTETLPAEDLAVLLAKAKDEQTARICAEGDGA